MQRPTNSSPSLLSTIHTYSAQSCAVNHCTILPLTTTRPNGQGKREAQAFPQLTDKLRQWQGMGRAERKPEGTDTDIRGGCLFFIHLSGFLPDPPKGVTTVIQNPTPIREGDSVTLSCTFNSSNPRVTRYNWNSPGSQDQTSQEKLTIQKVTWDTAPVKCEACNQWCSWSPSVNLNVHCECPRPGGAGGGPVGITRF